MDTANFAELLHQLKNELDKANPDLAEISDLVAEMDLLYGE